MIAMSSGAEESRSPVAVTVSGLGGRSLWVRAVEGAWGRKVGGKHQC